MIRNCRQRVRRGILGLSFAATVATCLAAEPLERNGVDRDRIQKLAADLRARVNDRTWAGHAYALKREGDRKYRRKDYRGAQQQYREAYPNLPEPYSFVLAADAQLRAVFNWNRARASDSTQCLRNGAFSSDLRTELSQVYSVGLGIADALEDEKLVTSKLFRRAARSEACLWSLTLQSEARPRDECADMEALKSCLGTPLLK
jgi:hypothetical protein